MSIFKAFFLGIIQGITEFLPISSSGHMSLFYHFATATKGLWVPWCVLQHPVFDELRGIATDDSPGLDVFCHDRASGHNSPFPNCHK